MDELIKKLEVARQIGYAAGVVFATGEFLEEINRLSDSDDKRLLLGQVNYLIRGASEMLLKSNDALASKENKE